MTDFTPSTLFSAVAVTAHQDPDLPDGRHLRIVVAPELGPPLGPIAVWRSSIGSRGTIAARDTTIIPRNPGSRVVAVGAASGFLALQDNDGSEILRRTVAPTIVAAPEISRVFVGAPTTLRPYLASADVFGKLLQLPPERMIAIPYAQPTPWYAGAITSAQAMERVKRGAPRRWTALDRPVGPFDFIQPADEATRIAGADGATLNHYAAQLEAMWTPVDPRPPLRRVQTYKEPADEANAAPASSADVPAWGTLVLQAIDYGAARYCGLATVLDPVQAEQPSPITLARIEPGLEALWIASLFALAPDTLLETYADGDGTTTAALADWPVDPIEAMGIAALVKLTPSLAKVVDNARAKGLQVRAALTVAAAPPPPDYPHVGFVSIGTATWIPQAGSESVAWRQQFRFGELSPAIGGMAIASRFGSSQPKSRNLVDKGTGRVQLMAVGRDLDGKVVLSDRVLAGGLPVTYRFAVADMFGRFGPVTSVPVPPPPRPVPPIPQPQIVVTRAPVAAGTAKAQPGTAHVRIPVPPVETLAAGARPIKVVSVTLENTPVPTTAPINNVVSLELPLPELLPMATGTWTLRATFTDEGGLTSSTATSDITVTDGRAPAALHAGPGLIWTSRAANAAEVEVALHWGTSVSAAAHVYEASAASLLAAIKPAVDTKTLSRAEIAQLVWSAAQDPATPLQRTAFARLTEAPVSPGLDGLHFTATLPRSQRTVVFLRIVAVSAGGVEADFVTSGMVAVAVPDDLPPPAPLLTGRVTSSNVVSTNITLTIEATGLNLAILHHAEPYLPPKTPPIGEVAQRPEYRLRRASGRVTDPLYARTLFASAALELPLGAAPTPIASYVDTVPSFVPCTWWAEVRMPPERVLPAGVTVADSGIRAAFEWQRTPMAAPWSRLSSPFTTLPAPGSAPLALKLSQVTIHLASKGETADVPPTYDITINVTGLPVVAAGAIGPYQLQVWLAQPNLPLSRYDPNIAITSETVHWQASVGFLKPTACCVVLVDPLGRESLPCKVPIV